MDPPIRASCQIEVTSALLEKAAWRIAGTVCKGRYASSIAFAYEEPRDAISQDARSRRGLLKLSEVGLREVIVHAQGHIAWPVRVCHTGEVKKWVVWGQVVTLARARDA